MAEQKEYKEFRALLLKGMNGRNQKEIAQESDISVEHLNRMLNRRFIGQPSKMTLTKLARCLQGVSLGELFSSCGYMNEAAILMKDDSELTVKQQRMKMTVKDRIEATKKDMMYGFKASTYHQGYVYSEFQDLFDQVNLLYSAEDITYDVREMGSYTGRNHLGAEQYAVVDICFTLSPMKTRMIMVLFYFDTACGNLLITDAAFDGASLLEVDAIPKDILDDFTKYGICVPLLEDVTISLQQTKEELHSEAGERLLRALFGEYETYETILHGFGFYVPDDLSNVLPAFLAAHKDAFCENAVEEQLYHQVVDEQKNPYEVFATYEDSYTEETGVGAVLSNILSRELGISFEFYDDKDHRFAENKPCVIYSSMNKGMDELGGMLYDYAKELGIPYLQECYFKTLLYKDENAIIKVE